MELKQFYDENLAHASYAILSEDQVALIDPARDPQQYFDFAEANKAKIVAIIETHPHADFVSSHAEISRKTGAPIYVSKLLKPDYSYISFDEGDELKLGKIRLVPINTPGHSPDSICIIIKDEDGKDYAIATGDTLFVGDVGRPDLREKAGAINKSKEELAGLMYHSINEKLRNLPDSMLVYPAHGAGSLCGKSTSTENFTTIGKEKKDNYAFQINGRDNFIKALLSEQSYIPKYFGFDVELNRKGAPDFSESISKVERLNSYDEIREGYPVIDIRDKKKFAAGHLKGAINLREEKKFETWLGSIISPDEKFYIIAENDKDVERIIRRIAKIGYESMILGVLTHRETAGLVKTEPADVEYFRNNKDKFTIVDVRNRSEVDSRKIFSAAIPIPLHELRERYKEIPTDKPVMIHCAAGFRSAAAASILQSLLETKVFDLGDSITEFSNN